ncbi:hypothetical protein ACIQ8D_06345 [Streptomyces sp. NPDC096094]
MFFMTRGMHGDDQSMDDRDPMRKHEHDQHPGASRP